MNSWVTVRSLPRKRRATSGSSGPASLPCAHGCCTGHTGWPGQADLDVAQQKVVERGPLALEPAQVAGRDDRGDTAPHGPSFRLPAGPPPRMMPVPVMPSWPMIPTPTSPCGDRATTEASPVSMKQARSRSRAGPSNNSPLLSSTRSSRGRDGATIVATQHPQQAILREHPDSDLLPVTTAAGAFRCSDIRCPGPPPARGQCRTISGWATAAGTLGIVSWDKAISDRDRRRRSDVPCHACRLSLQR